MRCENCNTEHEEKICPNCNGLTDTVQNNELIKKTGKLLGFRTNKIWKKIVSILYLIFCFIYLLGVIGTEKYVNITNHDFIISQICDSLIFVILIAPYIFLSNTKFRNILPLFKKHSIGASAIGLIIVTIIIGVISGIIDASHSEEFLNDRENHAYTETVTEATCEKAGEIKKFCEYCGISETKISPKLKHKKIEISKTEPSCENAGEIIQQCELCKKEFRESLKAIGHNMTEISRKDATEATEGEIVEECSVCGKQKKTVLEKIKTNSSTKTSSSESKTSSKSESASSTNSSSKDNSITNSSDNTSSSTSTVKQDKTPEEIKIEYIDSCDYVDCEWLLRRPNDYIGNRFVFEGKVFQTSVELFGEHNIYFIRVNTNIFDNQENIIYVKYLLPADATKILEGDTVNVYGEFQGEHTYITTDWDSKTVPLIEAEYIDIVIP